MFFPNPRNKPSTQTNIWQAPNWNPATKSISKKILQPNLIFIKSKKKRNKSNKPIVHVKENKSKPESNFIFSQSNTEQEQEYPANFMFSQSNPPPPPSIKSKSNPTKQTHLLATKHNNK